MNCGKLVRFFEALSQQPMPYIPEEVPTLTAKETDMARSLFSSTAAPCLKCHATGDPQHDRIAAPNFLLARERLKPDWAERWITDPQASVRALRCLPGFPPAKRTVGFRWTDPAFVRGLREGPHQAAGGLHFPVDARGTAAGGRGYGSDAGFDSAVGQRQARRQFIGSASSS